MKDAKGKGGREPRPLISRRGCLSYRKKQKKIRKDQGEKRASGLRRKGGKGGAARGKALTEVGNFRGGRRVYLTGVVCRIRERGEQESPQSRKVSCEPEKIGEEREKGGWAVIAWGRRGGDELQPTLNTSNKNRKKNTVSKEKKGEKGAIRPLFEKGRCSLPRSAGVLPRDPYGKNRGGVDPGRETRGALGRSRRQSGLKGEGGGRFAGRGEKKFCWRKRKEEGKKRGPEGS